MKQQIIYTTIFTLALSSQLVSAGSITDTYTSGDTLTATTLDNIKTAVNDNDSNSDANTSNIGLNTSDISTNSGDITALEDSKSVAEYNRTQYLASAPNILTTTPSTVSSVTINAPASGKVIVSFSGQYSINHTSGTADSMCIELETSSSANPYPACDGSLVLVISFDASYRRINKDQSDLTDYYNGGIHSQQVFNVAAGSHTFYVRGQSNSTGTTIALRQSNVIAHFVAD